MPAKLKEVESSFKNNGEKTGVSNKVCQKVQKGAKRAALASESSKNQRPVSHPKPLFHMGYSHYMPSRCPIIRKLCTEQFGDLVSSYISNKCKVSDKALFQYRQLHQFGV